MNWSIASTENEQRVNQTQNPDNSSDKSKASKRLKLTFSAFFFFGKRNEWRFSQDNLKWEYREDKKEESGEGIEMES